MHFYLTKLVLMPFFQAEVEDFLDADVVGAHLIFWLRLWEDAGRVVVCGG